MDYKKRALEIQDQIINNRREIHKNPELHFNLDKTLALVERELKSYGIEPKRVGKAGITALIGSGSPVVLLRGDMDALKMKEETGLEFSSEIEACHSCGHDGHTSMLLAAGRMLKENEENLKGTVKLMFQPAEEILQGAKDMIENGVLEDPKVDAAFAIHLFPGEEYFKTGSIRIARGQFMSSGDVLVINIKGVQSHGSTPELGVDAIVVASHIVIGLQNILAREISMFDNCVVLVGKITGGATVNTTPGYATIELSARAVNEEKREFILSRIREIARGVAETFRAQVEINHPMGSASLYNNEDLVDDVLEFSKDIVGEENIKVVPMMAGTEDFAYIAQKVPAAMIHLGSGSTDEGYMYGIHSPLMTFNEEVLPIGASLLADLATKYLEKYSK